MLTVVARVCLCIRRRDDQAIVVMMVVGVVVARAAMADGRGRSPAGGGCAKTAGRTRAGHESNERLRPRSDAPCRARDVAGYYRARAQKATNATTTNSHHHHHNRRHASSSSTVYLRSLHAKNWPATSAAAGPGPNFRRGPRQ